MGTQAEKEKLRQDLLKINEQKGMSLLPLYPKETKTERGDCYIKLWMDKLHGKSTFRVLFYSNESAPDMIKP